MPAELTENWDEGICYIWGRVQKCAIHTGQEPRQEANPSFHESSEIHTKLNSTIKGGKYGRTCLEQMSSQKL